MIEVYGAYGILKVHAYSGAVLSYDPDYSPEYDDIIRFNVSEARAYYGDDFKPGTSWDIVLLDFWTQDGAYVTNERATVEELQAELST